MSGSLKQTSNETTFRLFSIWIAIHGNYIRLTISFLKSENCSNLNCLLQTMNWKEFEIWTWCRAQTLLNSIEKNANIHELICIQNFTIPINSMSIQILFSQFDSFYWIIYKLLLCSSQISFIWIIIYLIECDGIIRIKSLNFGEFDWTDL